MRGAHSVALLQLCDAVPVVQLLGLILTSPHVEAVPSYDGQDIRAHSCGCTLSTNLARPLDPAPSHLEELQAGYTVLFCVTDR